MPNGPNMPIMPKLIGPIMPKPIGPNMPIMPKAYWAY